MKAVTAAVVIALFLNVVASLPANATVRPRVIPGSLHFKPQLYRGAGVTNSASPQNLLLSNSTKGPAISTLTIEVSGTNEADFGIISNDCTSGLAAGGKCSV